MRIAPYDKSDLLVPPPSFKLRFTGQSFVHVVVGFPVEQADNIVAIGKTLIVMELVLKDPTVKVASDADVEGARQATHEIDAIVLAVSGHRVRIVTEGGPAGCDGCHEPACSFTKLGPR